MVDAVSNIMKLHSISKTDKFQWLVVSLLESVWQHAYVFSSLIGMVMFSLRVNTAALDIITSISIYSSILKFSCFLDMELTRP